MATTPNYGWVMPDPTDFVTSLPADFEIFGDAVDADLAGLLGGTAGQVLVKNSGTDHDYDFAADPVSDIVTTAGDLLYGTAADTLVRLGIGTANQLLAVNAGATAPEWKTLTSGGMSELASGSLSGSSTSLTGISGAFKDLKLVLRKPKSSSTSNIRFTFNTNTTQVYAKLNNVTTQDVIINSTGTFSNINISSGIFTTSNDGICTLDLYDYVNATTFKTGEFNMAANTAASDVKIQAEDIFFLDTTAITSIQIVTSAGSWNGGTYILYGVS